MSSPIKLYKLPAGAYVERGDKAGYLDNDWDSLFENDELHTFLSDVNLKEGEADLSEALAPIGSQEVWACGVTYYSSQQARVEESKGGGSFYERIYAAERPEIFFKATPARVSGPGDDVRIRKAPPIEKCRSESLQRFYRAFRPGVQSFRYSKGATQSGGFRG